MSDLLRRTLGEQIAIETVLAGGLWRDPRRPQPARERAPQPRGQRARRDAGGRPADHRDRQHRTSTRRYAARQDEVVPGQYVMLAVTDTGIGMSPRGRWPGRSSRSSPPRTSARAPGSASARSMASSSSRGGHVKIYSELGEGTTVKIYLPRLRGDGRAAEPAEEADAPRRGRRPRDDPGRRGRRRRARAFSADPARARLPRARGGRRPGRARSSSTRQPEIALLFTDVGLPGGMNGRAARRGARAGAPGPQGAVHDRLRAQRHRPRRPPRPRRRADHQAVHARPALAAKLRDMLDARAAPPLRPAGRGRGAGAHARRRVRSSELGFRVEDGGLGDRGARQAAAARRRGSMR